MPVPIRTFNDGKAIYSVDMMLAYINTHKPPVIEAPVETFLPQLNQKVWGDWSPADVLKKPSLKKYAENVERIEKADLSYAVIVSGKEMILVDGYHRVAKAVRDGRKKIKVVIFNAPLMKKFILNTDMDFVKVHQETSISDILELWSKRFC
jgi:hypothetical protein